MKKIFAFLFFLVFSMAIFTTYAFAYIDPATVSVIFSVIAGIVVTVGAAVGFYWRRIVRFFKKKNNADEYDEEYDDSEDEDDE